MNNWINRYVAAVVGRLPENERAEVTRELKSSIYDMLSENPTEAEVKHVLQEMGSPAELAEEYRQNPRYLISPRIYDDYIRMLKVLVPIFALIIGAIGAFRGGIEAFQTNGIKMTEVFELIIGDGISSGVSGAMEALVLITIGYVIAERTGMIGDKKKEEWKLEDLPQPQEGKLIPLSDPIGELIAAFFFCGWLALIGLGLAPFVAFTNDQSVEGVALFSDSFAMKVVPIMVVLILLTVISSLKKITQRRWTSQVCFWVIVDNLVSALLWIFLFMQRNIFSTEFIRMMQEQEWSSGDVLHYISTGNTTYIQLIICGIIVVVTLIEIGSAIYKTAKNTSVQATVA
ncbi:HAAS signaling domain-containing protein [Enterococcus sp. AZ109]|uniref:HAAS signaling domain-containing protein n=1 Tax=Enterococcus sp. AZ109 TaxID=2774634 RepID=UPI003F26DF83